MRFDQVLEVSVAPPRDKRYPIIVRGPGGDARGSLILPLRNAKYIALMTRLHERSTDECVLMELGQMLFRALFRKSIYDVYTRSQGVLKDGQGLRLVLNVAADDSDVALLPWEFLYDPNRGPLALLDISVVRYLPQQSVIPKMRAELPLKVLLTGAVTSPKADIERELQLIEDALALVRAHLPAVIAMQLSVAHEVTLAFASELYQALAEGLPIDACVNEGRKAVMNMVGLGQPDWGIPVVYTRSHDGLLFDVPPIAKPRCPYPGMAPFRPEDATSFFGRDNEIERMVQLLRDEDRIIVIGPSGSGKSSLLYGGLLPRVGRSSLFPDGYWLIRDMRPGPHPLLTLAHILQSHSAADPQAVTKLLEAHRPAQRVLLIIDQFEEVFTQVARDEQREFISNILALSDAAQGTVLIAIRADFYPDLINSDLWPIPLEQRLEVAPLRGALLRQAIEQPAKNAGVRLEPGLIERLLADAADEPGILPLVQETLVLLWDRMQGHLLTLHAYRRIGNGERSGLAMAMVTRADTALRKLNSEERAIARRIFLRLVQFGEGRADTRRQQPVSALRSVHDSQDLFEHTLHHLANHRLITLSSEDETHGRATVDLAHEILIESWPTFQAWLRERREVEQTRRRLESKVAEWIRLGQSSGGLLDAVELQEAERWLGSPEVDDVGIDKDLPLLIRKSREAIDIAEQAQENARQREIAQAHALAEAERQRAEEQQQRATEQIATTRRLRRWFWGVVAALVVAVVAGGTAGYSLIQTQRQNRINTARRLTAEAQASLDRFPQRAALLSIEALRTADGEKELPSATMEEALRHAIGKLNGHGLGVVSKDSHPIVSPDNRWLVTVEGRTAKLWDLITPDTARVPFELHGHSSDINPFSVVVSSDSHWLVTADPGAAMLWDLTSSPPKRTSTFSATSGYLHVDGISYNSQWLVTTTSEDPVPRLWRLSEQGVPSQPIALLCQKSKVTSSAMSSDGRWLATSGQDGSVCLWDLTLAGNTSPQRVVSMPEIKILSRIELSPDGQWLIVVGNEGTIDLLRMTTSGSQQPVRLPRKVDSIPYVRISPDGHWLVTAGLGDTNAYLWDLTTSDPLSHVQVLAGHEEDVNYIRISPNSHWLLTSGSNEPAPHLWDLTSRNPSAHPILLTGHEEGFNAIEMSPDSHWLLTVGMNDDTPRLWDLTKDDPSVSSIPLYNQSIQNVVSRFGSARFSNDSRWVVTVSQDLDASIQVWDLRAEVPSSSPIVLHGHESPVSNILITTDSYWLITLDRDSTARMFDLSSSNLATDPSVAILARPESPVGYYYQVAVSPDNTRLAAAKDTQIYLWNRRLSFEKQAPIILSGHQRFIDSMIFSDDSRYLVTGSRDGMINVWDLQNPSSPPASVTFHRVDGEIETFRVALSTNNHWLIAMSSDSQSWDRIRGRWEVKLWDFNQLTSSSASMSLPGTEGTISAIAISPNNRWLIGNIGDSFALWDLTSDQIFVKSFDLPARSLRVLAISADGRWLATTGGQRAQDRMAITDEIYVRERANLWDLTRYSAEPIVLRGHESDIQDAIFSNDGDWLITDDDDSVIFKWDVNAADISNSSTNIYNGENSYLYGIGNLSISAGGDDLYFSGRGGAIYNIPLRVDSLLTIACDRIGRNFSWEEWNRFFQKEQYRKSCSNLSLHPSVVNAGRDLAAQGNVEAALAQFALARRLQPSLDPMLEKEARAIALGSLSQQSENLARAGKIRESLSVLSKAESIDPPNHVHPSYWATLCRFGSLRGYAREVLTACERAVSLASSNEYFRDSRGIARALTGDFKGAIEDFEYYISQTKDESFLDPSRQRREEWIQSLRQGKNPLDQQTLTMLLQGEWH